MIFYGQPPSIQTENLLVYFFNAPTVEKIEMERQLCVSSSYLDLTFV